MSGGMSVGDGRNTHEAFLPRAYITEFASIH
jgi:hypothetical protein